MYILLRINIFTEKNITQVLFLLLSITVNYHTKNPFTDKNTSKTPYTMLFY